MNKLRLCTNLIKFVNGPNFPPFEEFPVAQRVTYKYYAGRINMFDSEFGIAKKNLEYSFEHCHKRKPKNKRYKI